MTDKEEVIVAIDAVILTAREVYVYNKQCEKVAEVLKSYKTFLNDTKLDQSPQLDELNTVLNDLTDLIITIENLLMDKWAKDCLSIPVVEPTNKITSSMKSIEESMTKLGFKNQSVKFCLTNDEIASDYYTLYGIFANPSAENPKIHQKRNEVSDCLKQLNKPLPGAKVKIEQDGLFDLIKKVKLSHSQYTKSHKVEKNDMIFYKGKMKGTNQRVSIVRISNNDQSLIKRMVSCLLLAKHPSLVTFIGATTSKPYDVVCSRNGETLRHCLKSQHTKTQLDAADKTIIAYKIAEGMAYLHSRKIFHRDLCAENIYIERTSKSPKIANFAFSRLIPEDVYDAVTGTINGASTFMAPEQIEGGHYDEKVDVFAFAGVLYEMLTGAPPFSDLSEIAASEKIFNGERPDLPKNISKDFQNLIESCWDQNPKQRPTFVDILRVMLKEKVMYTEAKEELKKSSQSKVNKFYSSKSVKVDDVKICIDLINYICNLIGEAEFYTREALRVRALLCGYQYELQSAPFATDEFSPDNYQIYSDLQNLRQSLEKLVTVVRQLNMETWGSIAFSKPVPQITEDFLNIMEDVCITMNSLNLSVPQIKFSDSDLTTDYRNLYTVFEQNRNVDERHAKIRIKEIHDYLAEHSLSLGVTTTEIDDRVSRMFSKYHDFYVKRDNYELLNPLGDGYSSVVYLAKDKTTGQEVAVKVFKEEYLEDEGTLFYLKREVDSLVKLHHEYLSKFIGYNADEMPLWVINEVVPDGDLFDVLHKKRSLNGFQITKVAFEIAEGMEYLHSKRVMHRDLKTGNVLIDGDTPKITDFGYSKANMNLEMTMGVGTLNYMAPEVIEGGLYSLKADVFSYSMMLWEMYYGTYPYSHLSTPETQMQIMNGVNLPYDKPISLNLKKLIMDGYQSNPSKRPTFTEIIQRMISEKIAFPGADPDKVNEFYNQKIQKRMKIKTRNPSEKLNRIRSVNKILSLSE
ncbi:hypothetical protein TRFO_05917 [Tritrichomonas foetus]|uniref:Protein kinase domain-containing protein n=1 Tax=Tritrichomonas foetus TaxID=1144522 RepID=A0A1J4K7F2_9EUKA|nr:hypothetical protein TRFO_05917 [Tritrichomonas foetus]|eukprot:OHT05341.1 hypothetical protein TRFO_05917 [Tritrichomonas foetus]